LVCNLQVHMRCGLVSYTCDSANMLLAVPKHVCHLWKSCETPLWRCSTWRTYKYGCRDFIPQNATCW
jgi:hypothetical protein